MINLDEQGTIRRIVLERPKAAPLDRFLYWLTGNLPCRIISDEDNPYLERYHLFSVAGITADIHRFVASDPDRGMHNHPWRWALSFILRRFYLEETHYGTRTVRWINGLVGDSFHRVILPPGTRDVWTLFIHPMPKVKTWGFLRNKGQLGTVFEEYHYAPNELGKTPLWWLKAPRGKNCEGRLPL